MTFLRFRKSSMAARSEPSDINPHPLEQDGAEKADHLILDEKDETSSALIQLQQCQWTELISAVFAGFLFLGLHYVPGKIKNILYIAFLAIGFGSYVVYKMKKFGIRLVAEDWGLTLNNFKITFLWCTAVGILGLVVMLIYMAILGTGLPFHYDLILMLILYPIWGVIQQFLVQNMIAMNLSKTKLHIHLVYLLTACSFTLVHFPQWLLMLATFLLGYMFTPIFLKWRCLYPLGLYHGWCGAVLYWLVLEEDPMERFG